MTNNDVSDSKVSVAETVAMVTRLIELRLRSLNKLRELRFGLQFDEALKRQGRTREEGMGLLFNEYDKRWVVGVILPDGEKLYFGKEILKDYENDKIPGKD